MATETAPARRLHAWWEARVERHPDITCGPQQQEEDIELGRDLAPGRVVVMSHAAEDDVLTFVRGSVMAVDADRFTFVPASEGPLPDAKTGATIQYIAGRSSVLLPTRVRDQNGDEAVCDTPDVVLRTDRRQFTRVRIVLPVVITDQTGKIISGRSINMSGDGMSVSVPSEWESTPIVAVRFGMHGATWTATATVIDVHETNAEQKLARLHMSDFQEGSAEELHAAIAG